jgi:guanylate kinase
LLAADPRLWLSRSWTTRPQRAGEPDDAYVFVDRETFLERVRASGFVEWFEVYGDLKGTPDVDTPPDRDVVLEIDLQGADAVKELHPDAFVVFVRPPSREEQERRLRERGDSDNDIARRLDRADAEEAAAEARGYPVVVNDDADQALAELQRLIEDARRGSR